ncbi:hypothetical protein LCGC14_0454010 [marine sediment metagenome]|uniref:Uncharacterized protein n=1 Tax=marine sediment metagenome TaxID=412755 RepID=A0A0F9V3S7_9ZZZZ|nr:hypothetical protein [bacterium]
MKRSLYLVSMVVFTQVVILANIIPFAQEGQGIAISHPDFPDGIIVDLSTNNVINSEDVYYRVTNNDNIPLNVSADGEVINMENWQDNFTISWNVNSVFLLQNESFVFIPRIEVNVDLSFNYTLHLIFRGDADINGTIVVIAAKGVLLKLRVLTELSGYNLFVRTTDQADFERESHIKIFYGGNGEQAQGWSIFKDLIDSRFSSVVLAGWYQIQATHLRTNNSLTEFVLLNESKQIDMVYNLVSLQVAFELPTPTSNKWNFTYIVENRYIEIKEVSFVFQIFQKNSTNHFTPVTEAKVEEAPIFPKGSLKSSKLTFEKEWTTGKYFFISRIYVGGTPYFEKISETDLNFPWYEDFFLTPYYPLMVLGITFMAGAVVFSLVRKIIFRPKPIITPDIRKKLGKEDRTKLDEFEKIRKSAESE